MIKAVLQGIEKPSLVEVDNNQWGLNECEFEEVQVVVVSRLKGLATVKHERKVLKRQCKSPTVTF